MVLQAMVSKLVRDSICSLFLCFSSPFFHSPRGQGQTTAILYKDAEFHSDQPCAKLPESVLPTNDRAYGIKLLIDRKKMVCKPKIWHTPTFIPYDHSYRGQWSPSLLVLTEYFPLCHMSVSQFSSSDLCTQEEAHKLLNFLS